MQTVDFTKANGSVWVVQKDESWEWRLLITKELEEKAYLSLTFLI